MPDNQSNQAQETKIKNQSEEIPLVSHENLDNLAQAQDEKEIPEPECRTDSKDKSVDILKEGSCSSESRRVKEILQEKRGDPLNEANIKRSPSGSRGSSPLSSPKASRSIL